MALKKVVFLLGQSNQEGVASKLLLPASLRGVQANTYIFNYENNARELLNCDGAGANLPNNNTAHTAGVVGPEMSLAAAAVAELGEIDIFKFAVTASPLGPSVAFRSWNADDQDLYLEMLVRWNAYVAVMAGLGHTVEIVLFSYLQGEADSGIEGHDEAYFGLFKRLKKDMLAFLASYVTTTTKWVTCLINGGVTQVPGYQHLYNRIQNIRAAQRKAGWIDANYRVVDTELFSHSADYLHMDTDGVQACGTAVWNAHNLTYNNSMAFEDYDLASLRTRLAEEFGIDTSIAENNAKIDRRINDAVAWVVNRRKNWPWLERQTSIDIGERSNSATDARYGAGLFLLAQKNVTNCVFNLTGIEPREFVDFGGSGLVGIMAESYSGTTIQLRQGYKGDIQLCSITAITVGNPTVFTVHLTTSQGGTAVIPQNVTTFPVIVTGTTHSLGNYNGTYAATRLSNNTFSIPINSTGHIAPFVFGSAQIGVEFTISQGLIELPEDFIRSATAHLDEDPNSETLVYRSPQLYEREIRSDRKATSISRIYTVISDPLNISSRKFLAPFPFFTRRNTLHIKYYGDAKKLIADGDVPDIPRSDRFVVLYAAGWFVAQWQKDNDLVAFYRDGALGELEKMTKEHQFSDDTTEDFDSPDDPLDPIRGPSGFPRFDA